MCCYNDGKIVYLKTLLDRFVALFSTNFEFFQFFFSAEK